MRAARFHGRGGQGEVVHTYIPKRKPVEAYLKLRGWFRHLFEPNRQDEAIRRIQERVDA
jgi:pyruvate ferredoxin oxidoreductase beta subunit